MTGRRPLYLILAALLGLSLLLPGAAGRTMHGIRELRVSLTARNMAEGGSWLYPEYRGQLRLKKPPLAYWLSALSFKAFGTTASPLAARLPQVLSGAALLALIYAGGAPLIGRRRALAAAAAGGTTTVFLVQGATAESDTALCLFTALAALAGYQALTQPRAARWWLLTGLAAGLGFMTKGPAAVGLPLAALIVFGLSQRRRPKTDWPGVILGLVVCAAVAVPWYALIHFFTSGGAAGAAVSGELSRTFAGTGQAGPWYYYFEKWFEVMSPAGILLPFGLWTAWRRGRHHPGLKFALAWFLTSFVILSLTSAKQRHYALLMVPPAALLEGWFLGYAFNLLQSWRRKVARIYIGLILSLTGLCGAALVLWPFVRPPAPAVPLATGGLALIAAAAAGFLKIKNQLQRLVLGALALALIVGLFYNCLSPQFEDETLIPEFARAARPHLAGIEKVWGGGTLGWSMEFYLPEIAVWSSKPLHSYKRAQPGQAIIVVGDHNHPLKLDQIPSKPTLLMTRGRAACALYIK